MKIEFVSGRSSNGTDVDTSNGIDVNTYRSNDEKEIIVFRERNSNVGDILNVYLNKRDSFLFSYDFSDPSVSDPCKMTKMGRSWLKRSGRLEDGVSCGVAAKIVVDDYYRSWGN